ncbi:family S53 protease [Stereum hirsutum FP-91666 SS1]|uniref:family S53 protease n=1 Tax=Stereum hirsutum (strain FP-91666) TaxID=721885 RepID=UPI000440D3D8|nr:family S53 protease [Stereum hirsutum FP-91666 SS1]EIM89476.1 family S53 protease [Stereum hirsutum FP-91666 SS1]
MVVHERRDSVPSGFVHVGAAPEDEVLSLKFALTQSNFPGLESELYAISTPGSERYRQFLSKEQVEAFVAPSTDTASSFNDWLASNNLTSTLFSPAGDWVSVNMTVSQANDVLGADFSTFQHQATGQTAIRTLQYSVPSSLKEHVSFVHPTVVFPVPNTGSKMKTSAKPVSPPKTVTGASVVECTISLSRTSMQPACLIEMYNIPRTPATQASNIMAVSGFTDENANRADLQAFLAYFRPDMDSNATYTLEELDGGEDDQTIYYAGAEADLDLQYTIGVATGVPVQFVSVGYDNTDGIAGFIDEVNFLLAEDVVPNVLTTSYAFNEPSLAFNLVNNLCNAYAQLTARGTTAFTSSGDGGVGGTYYDDCTFFVPSFPSTCPYVTSVGGTTGVGPEVAAPLSGGGFSTYFAVPSFQSDMVSSWQENFGSRTYNGLYNSTGRGFPDVSAQAINFYIQWTGGWYTVNGTSASTPSVASVFAMLDDELVAAGQPPLGWLNPLIYANPQAFNDITSGNNPGCGTNGFSAGASWDPVTGLGSPDYNSLKTVLGL